MKTSIFSLGFTGKDKLVKVSVIAAKRDAIKTDKDYHLICAGIIPTSMLSLIFINIYFTD